MHDNDPKHLRPSIDMCAHDTKTCRQRVTRCLHIDKRSGILHHDAKRNKKNISVTHLLKALTMYTDP